MVGGGVLLLLLLVVILSVGGDGVVLGKGTRKSSDVAPVDALYDIIT